MFQLAETFERPVFGASGCLCFLINTAIEDRLHTDERSLPFGCSAEDSSDWHRTFVFGHELVISLDCLIRADCQLVGSGRS